MKKLDLYFKSLAYELLYLVKKNHLDNPGILFSFKFLEEFVMFNCIHLTLDRFFLFLNTSKSFKIVFINWIGFTNVRL